ncbi:DUF3276 family protein [Parasediminibacterium sp. JCM 36343]|uniref:DUF3276 family protein n=1 Tax=Parasediminibacterium sp. JCM 36343 TaxID=3374279 RepID=UPI00397C6CAC
MGYEGNENKITNVYSNRIKAGVKRTYFFDVKETRNNGCCLVVTESRKRFDDRGYDRNSIYIYKEDINKFAKGLTEAVDYIKTELLPNYDFSSYDNAYASTEYIGVETEKIEREYQKTENIEMFSSSSAIEKQYPLNIDEIDKW